MAEAKKAKNVFGEGFDEVKAGKFVNWCADNGKGNIYVPVGEVIKGILVGRDEREDQLKGGTQMIYTLQGEDGVEFQLGSRGKIFDSSMKKIVEGQWVAFHYAEDIKSKTAGNNDFKLIKVAAGGMDEAYIKENDLSETNVDDIDM